MTLQEITQKSMKPSWYSLLKEYLESDPFTAIIEYLRERIKITAIYPLSEQVFNAFNQFETYDLKVVILGQDPYHTPGIANGLCFSTAKHSYIPPSLKNIFKEMEDDLKVKVNSDKAWKENLAQQGVLLLNTALTVEQGKPNSHSKLWANFTDFVLKQINETQQNIVFILWGEHAKSYKPLIDSEKHHIIESAHPSPLSARLFFGSKPFSKCNEILSSINKTEITWHT